MSKIKIGHLVLDFLNLSEPWLYDQIRSADLTNPIVLARNVKNSHIYPVPQIFKYPLLSDLVTASNLPQIILRKNLALLQKIKEFFITDQINYFAKVIANQDIKLIHAHYGPTGYLGLKLHEKTNLPLIVSFYGSDITLPKRIPGWFDRYQQMFKVAAAIVSVSNTMTKDLIELGCPKEKINLINHGIDTDVITYQKPQKTKHVKFLIASRLEPIKGIDFAIHAFHAANKKLKNISLTIIGSGSQEQVLKNLVSELNNQNITFHPLLPHDQLLKQICQYNIFLQSSLTQPDGATEGNPTSMLERMAAGLPIIATDHGDIKSVIINSETGMLIPENNLKSFSDAMIYIATHQDVWGKLTKKARKLIEAEYSLKAITKQRETLYQTLLSKNRS